MDSSKNFGDVEEYNSSTESGWTMYLCSPKHSDQSDIFDDAYISKSYKHEVEDESDDSMASDASSGPIRLVNSWEKGESGHVVFGNKVQAKEKNGGTCFSNKKAKKYQKRENENSVYTSKETEVSVKSNGKVRKSSWFGKRK